jgi:hypothetical protein
VQQLHIEPITALVFKVCSSEALQHHPRLHHMASFNAFYLSLRVFVDGCVWAACLVSGIKDNGDLNHHHQESKTAQDSFLRDCSIGQKLYGSGMLIHEHGQGWYESK